MNQLEKARENLLASGLPLETDVERAVAARLGARCVTDFAYARTTAVGLKEFSVDLQVEARLFSEFMTSEPPTEGSRRPTLRIRGDWNLLIECKYCKPGVMWLFTPVRPHWKSESDPPCGVLHHHYFVVRSACTDRLIVEHVGYVTSEGCDYRPSVSPGCSVPTTNRAVEIRPESGKQKDTVFDTRLREAFAQLSYGALPNAWPRCTGLLDHLAEHRSDGGGVTALSRTAAVCMYGLILVTTAELRVFRSDLDLDAVQRATDWDEISTPIDVVEYRPALSRELREHQRLIASRYRDWSGRSLLSDRDRREANALLPALRAMEELEPPILVVRHSRFESWLERQRRLVEEVISEAGKRVDPRAGFTVYE